MCAPTATAHAAALVPPLGPPQSPPALRLAERALGIDPTGTRDLFPPYTELPHKISRHAWLLVRVGSVLAYLAVVVTLFVRPAAGLFVFFHVIVFFDVIVLFDVIVFFGFRIHCSSSSRRVMPSNILI